MLRPDGAPRGFGPSMTNLDTVRTMLACFSAGDPQGQLDRCTDDVVYEAPYYGIERHGKAELAAMLAAVQERFDSVSYVVVDDFPAADPDLVIVEVRGDNHVRGGERRYRNHYIMFLYFRDGLVVRWREFSNPDVYRTAVPDHDRSARRVVVLDLSTGIAGPMTGMLLADHGAEVTKIEPPGGDPSRGLSRRAGLAPGQAQRRCSTSTTPRRPRPAARARDRAPTSLVESYAPGVDRRASASTTTRCTASNPRLVYCSITGYGDDGRHADRPGYDALVAARTGHQWESRGVPGGTIARLCRLAAALPDLVDPGRLLGRPRRGRARCSPASRGRAWRRATSPRSRISAALRVREQTGRGQQVRRRCSRACSPPRVGAGSASSTPTTAELPELDHRPARAQGLVPVRRRAVDAPLGAAPRLRPQRVGGRPRRSARRRPRVPGEAPTRIGMDADEMRPAAPLPPADGRRRSPGSRRDEWIALAAEVGVPVQPVRSPEEALLDPRSLADGCVVEVDDPELGPVRQVGRRRTSCTRARPTRPPRRSGGRRRHRRGAGRSRRARRRAVAVRRPASPSGAPRVAARGHPSCSTSGSRSPARGARRCSPTSAPTSSRSTRCTTATG